MDGGGGGDGGVGKMCILGIVTNEWVGCVV